MDCHAPPRFFCWADAGRSRVTHTVSVVTNTPWGQRSIHVLPLDTAHRDQREQCETTTTVANGGELLLPPRPSYSIQKQKILHVSPFNPTPDGRACWHYRLVPPTAQLDRFSLVVQSFRDAGMRDLVLSASMILKREETTEPSCLRGCNLSGLRGPYALLVQFRIHWQAVRLYRLGLTFYANTSCPYANVMHGSISHVMMVMLVLLGLGMVGYGAKALFALAAAVETMTAATVPVE